MELLGLLGVGGASVLPSALRFLDHTDAARLVVAVLEGGASDACARVHWLRCGATSLPPLSDPTLVDEAAAHACWRALAALLGDVRARSPPWVELFDDAIEDPPDLARDRAIQRATAAHRGTHYRFGHDVVLAAAAQGHVQAVRWLLPRCAESSGQTEPARRRAADEDVTRKTLLTEILRVAADARQLHVVQRIVDISPHCYCVHPYDEELEAVCWIVHAEKAKHSVYYFCATKQYGFSRERHVLPFDPNDLTHPVQMLDICLADAFARDGDLATLQKMGARDNHRHLIGSSAIAQAAQHGHLHVVQWLYELFPRLLTEDAAYGAARGGQLDILKWLRAEGVSITADAILEAAACGHLYVVRWFESVDSLRWRDFERPALESALKNGHIDVVRYLHGERGIQIDEDRAVKTLIYTSSVEVCDYVLTHCGPLPPLQALMRRFYLRVSLEVIQHLVLNRGLQHPSFFSLVAHHPDPPVASTTPHRNIKLELCRFLYNQAQERAAALRTTLHDQLDTSYMSILRLCDYDLAVWFLTSAPEFKVRGPAFEYMFLQPDRQKVVLACIRHRPMECHSVPWLPVWAVRSHNLEAFQLLATSGHPKMRDVETFRAITQYARDPRFVLKILPIPEDDSLGLCEDVVKWAASFGMCKVLDQVFERVAPTAQRRLLKHVAPVVGYSGHVEVANWLLTKFTLLKEPITANWKGIATEALRCGQTQVLEWLQKLQLTELSTPRAIEWMVHEAVAARRVVSLQWLLANTTVPLRLVGRILATAARRKDVEIVALLAQRYSPSDVPVSLQHRQQIRRILETHETHASGAVSVGGGHTPSSPGKASPSRGGKRRRTT